MKKNQQTYLAGFFLLLMLITNGVILHLHVRSDKKIQHLRQELQALQELKEHVLKAELIAKPDFASAMVNERLASLLKVYSAYDNNGPIALARYGKEHDGGYLTPVKAWEKADALLGYGIADDNSYEDSFSLSSGKPSYGFDCGVDHINSKSNLFTLVKECIATENFLYSSTLSSGKISSFQTQLDNLHLRGKKIFVKMDIEGAEYDALAGAADYFEHITGIALEIHFDSFTNREAVRLLENLEKHFLLVHVHGNNHALHTAFSTTNAIGKIPNALELTFINKNLTTHFHLSKNQKHPTPADMPCNKTLPEAVFEILPHGITNIVFN